MESNTVVFTRIEGKRAFFSIVDEKLHIAAFDTANTRDMDKIYLGRIQNILPNLKAAFVEYQKGVRGFLPLSDEQLNTYKCEMRLPVQITKEAVKTKDAVLSTELSLTGIYVVVTNRPGGLTFSKKIDKEKREKMAGICEAVIPEGKTCIVRTNVLSLKEEDYFLLVDEIKRLSERLNDIVKRAENRTFYSEIYEGAPFVEANLGKIDFDKVTKIVTDDKDEFDQLSQMVPSEVKSILTLYEDASFPLTALYSIKGKMHESLSRTVWLKSGGYLVVEPTEALTVIDVNSGKNQKKISKKELAALTNAEAAELIPYILSSRNISGIVVVDFISNNDEKEDAKLLKLLRLHMKYDYVKTDVVDITPLGLVEITRQKKDIPLKDQLTEVGLYETFRH